MPEITAPPRWILFLLWPFQGEPCYPQIEGDLSEEFQQRELEYGMAAARRWYCREVCRTLWSLTWRWVTIPVIILPLLCIALNYLLMRGLIGSIYRAHLPSSNWPILWILFASLLNSSIAGLFLGMICSRVLSGHERMVRLVFGAYYLGLLLIAYPFMSITILSPAPTMTAIGYLLIYLRPICTLICVWIGSIWIEHRHRRQSAAG
jgi:hypothetical protein